MSWLQMNPHVAKALLLLQRDLKCSVRELAETLRLSPSYFSYVFRLETGMKPSDYVKQIRLKAAKDLLSDCSLTVKEVVVAAGFSDQSHFSRDFKKQYGVTPSQFRKEAINAVRIQFIRADCLESGTGGSKAGP
jgi:two-component system, response regulator YesN